MTKDTGGPAFPLHNHGAQTLGLHVAGMTLRDYFAGEALQGYISATAWHPDFIYPDDFNFVAGGRAADAVAESAYKYADAMLKARQA